MNEIIVFKQVKKAMKYGVPKVEAKRIVEDVIDITGTDNIDYLENSVNYAISLTYRVEFSKIVNNDV